ncbi:MAG: hypothetical protein LBT40_17445 [Deltaproteobacteria bacterium]|nr:hypothetical protein [Deltaproteobacteria bacterium]
MPISDKMDRLSPKDIVISFPDTYLSALPSPGACFLENERQVAMAPAWLCPFTGNTSFVSRLLDDLNFSAPVPEVETMVLPISVHPLRLVDISGISVGSGCLESTAAQQDVLSRLASLALSALVPEGETMDLPVSVQPLRLFDIPWISVRSGRLDSPAVLPAALTAPARRFLTAPAVETFVLISRTERWWPPVPGIFHEGQEPGHGRSALEATAASDVGLAWTFSLARHEWDSAPPYPGALHAVTWPQFLFADIEHRIAGRRVSPVTRDILAVAVVASSASLAGCLPSWLPPDRSSVLISRLSPDAPSGSAGGSSTVRSCSSCPVQSPWLSPGLVASAGTLMQSALELAEASRARRLFAAAHPRALPDFMRDQGGMVPLAGPGSLSSREEAGTSGCTWLQGLAGHPSPRGALRFLDSAPASRLIADRIGVRFGIFREIEKLLQSVPLDGMIHGLDEAFLLAPAAFAPFCRAGAAAWSEEAECFFTLTLDAICMRGAVASVRDAPMAASSLAVPPEASGSAGDAQILRVPPGVLKGLPEFSTDMEESAPLAAAVIRLLKAPKPLFETVASRAPVSLQTTFGTGDSQAPVSMPASPVTSDSEVPVSLPASHGTTDSEVPDSQPASPESADSRAPASLSPASQTPPSPPVRTSPSATGVAASPPASSPAGPAGPESSGAGELCRGRIAGLGGVPHAIPELMERIVMSPADAGETDAASDIIAEPVRLSASGLAPLALPSRLPLYPAGEFMGILPGKIRSREPFASGAEGFGGVWCTFHGYYPQRRIFRSVESAAQEMLPDWLVFGTGLKSGAEQVPTAGAPPPRVFETAASGDHPLPVWGAGSQLGTFGLISEGEESRSVRGFLGELDAWHPASGMIPLAVSLSRLNLEASGRVGGWALRSQRDVLVVDMPLMAAAGATEPESRTARQTWVMRAAGAYGSLAPFGMDVPGRGAGSIVRYAPAARLALPTPAHVPPELWQHALLHSKIAPDLLTTAPLLVRHPPALEPPEPRPLARLQRPLALDMRPPYPLLGPQAIWAVRTNSEKVAQTPETVGWDFAGELFGKPDHGDIGLISSSCRSDITLRIGPACGTGPTDDRDCVLRPASRTEDVPDTGPGGFFPFGNLATRCSVRFLPYCAGFSEATSALSTAAALVQRAFLPVFRMTLGSAGAFACSEFSSGGSRMAEEPLRQSAHGTELRFPSLPHLGGGGSDASSHTTEDCLPSYSQVRPSGTSATGFAGSDTAVCSQLPLKLPAPVCLQPCLDHVVAAQGSYQNNSQAWGVRGAISSCISGFICFLLFCREILAALPVGERVLRTQRHCPPHMIKTSIVSRE